jgi:hypothetical protein
VNLVRLGRRRALGALLLVIGLGVAAMLTATTQAASNRITTKLVFSPHVLTVGEDGFLTISVINAGPSKINHAFAKVTQSNGSALPSSVTPFDLPDGCSVTATEIGCDFGQVAPGTVSRLIRFHTSATVSFIPRVSVSFDEGKGTQLTDTVVDDDFPFFIVGASDQTQAGRCDVIPEALTAADATQATTITAPALSTAFPCTPASAGLDATHQPLNVSKHFGEIAFVDFLDAGALAPVTLLFRVVPAGITKNNFALYELANFSPAGDQNIYLTATNGGAAVPLCNADLQIPAKSVAQGCVSCVVRFFNLQSGGVGADLRTRGGSDPGWGGIG